MNLRLHSLSITAALLTTFALVAPPALAGQHDKTASKASTQKTEPKKPEQKPEAKPSEAAAKKAPALAPMSLQLTGVTAENAAKATLALEALTVEAGTAWKCPSCSAMHDAKGECAKCKKELVATPRAAHAIKQANIDPIKGTLALVLAPGESVDLQTLGRTLTTQKITLDEKSVPVAAFSRLAITAPADAKDAQATIQKALDDSKLFTRVALRFDEAKKQWFALVEGVNGTPTYGAVGTAVELAGKDYHLNGLAWTGPCEVCTKAGMMQPNCKSCWRDAKPSKG